MNSIFRGHEAKPDSLLLSDENSFGDGPRLDEKAIPPEFSSRERETKPTSRSGVRLRSRTIMTVSIGVGLAFLGFIILLVISPPTTLRPLMSPLVGKPAPILAGTTVTGRSFSLTNFRDHYVFVDFFATWCATCVKEQPQLNAFVRQQDRPNGARLVQVIYGDSVSNVRSFLGAEVGTYPVLPDPTGVDDVHWGVGNAAEMYLVSPQGLVIAKIDGAVTVKSLNSLLTRARSGNA